jgi:rhodanese-related sulfurtransferase
MAMQGESEPDGARGPEPRRIGVGDAHALVEAGQATLVDVRDLRLYDNAHLRGAWSLPLAELRATSGRLPTAGPPPGDGLLILYCA